MSTYAIDTFTGTGSQVEFTITFNYISRDHVYVTRIDTASKAETPLTVITSGTPTGDQYIWEADNKIKLGTAPTTGETLRIQRDTPENLQIVQWADGSYIIAEDLNESDLQWLYNIQELYDGLAEVDGTVIGNAVKAIVAQLPIKVDSSNIQIPSLSVEETVSADDPNALTSDTTLMSEKAIDEAFKNLVGASAVGRKEGQLWINNTVSPQRAFYWSNNAWVELDIKGAVGPQGPPGPAPGLQTPAFQTPFDLYRCPRKSPAPRQAPCGHRRNW